MPRLRLRKALLALVVVAIVFLTLFHLSTYNESTPLVFEGARELFHSARNRPAPQLDDDSTYLNSISRQIESRNDENYFDDEQLTASSKLWFMKDGKVRPKPAEIDPVTTHRVAKLWPEETDDDRIVDQLMFIPPESKNGEEKKLKKILLYNGMGNWKPLSPGREAFVDNNCPVDSCELTADRNDAETADAILFTDHLQYGNIHDSSKRPSWQVWIIYLLECPIHTHTVPYKTMFNWTATYRRDSDIVAPYEKFVPYDKSKQIRLKALRNYAANKTKKVAWFVSNCGAQNGRNAYAAELGKYIDVDIYGTCGKLQCPRNDQSKCFSMLNTDYKFYLSFENSNCKDYVTEKFFVNGLGNDVVPIVLGASREDYKHVAPQHSYIHVEDFKSAKHLAEYLHMLDNNDTLYNEYFRWKGTGEFINTYFWCRVCAMLHDDFPAKTYRDVNDWWSGSGTCIKGRWDQT